jgi:hypothetical protein
MSYAVFEVPYKQELVWCLTTTLCIFVVCNSESFQCLILNKLFFYLCLRFIQLEYLLEHLKQYDSGSSIYKCILPESLSNFRDESISHLSLFFTASGRVWHSENVNSYKN